MGMTGAKRWSAVDAKKDKLPKGKIVGGELGCYMSHLTLWKKLYNDNVDSALVLEDDIIPAYGVGMGDIDVICKSSPGYTLIFLGHCGRPNVIFNTPKTKVGARRCTHAYIISRRGLEILTSMKHDFSVPVDHITEKLCKKNICYVSRHLDSPSKGDTYGIIHQDENLDNDINTRSI